MLNRRVGGQGQRVSGLLGRSTNWLRGLVDKLDGGTPSEPEVDTAPSSAGSTGSLELEGLRRRLSQLERSVADLVTASAVAADSDWDKPTGGDLRSPPLPEDWMNIGAAPESQVVATASASGIAGPVVQGNVSGVGLGTLFNLLENERLSGMLSLRHKRRELLFLFREGGIVRAEWNAARIAASDGVGIACSWAEADFNFRREPADDEMDAPRSANVLLLDAMRLRDESVRAS